MFAWNQYLVPSVYGFLRLAKGLKSVPTFRKFQAMHQGYPSVSQFRAKMRNRFQSDLVQSYTAIETEVLQISTVWKTTLFQKRLDRRRAHEKRNGISNIINETV